MTKKKEKEMSAVQTDRNYTVKIPGYNVTYGRIRIEDIIIIDVLKKGRESTLSGLAVSVQANGVLKPVDVVAWNEDGDVKYLLLDGLRRLDGAEKSGYEEIIAHIWEFDGAELPDVKDLIPLALSLNCSGRHSYKEQWERLQWLEENGTYTSDDLEFLLQMEHGDAMKLKDVMTSEFTEPKENLVSGIKGLEACYKLLMKLRKESEKAKIEADSNENGDVTDSVEKSKCGKNMPLSENDESELLSKAAEIQQEDAGEVSEGDLILNKADNAFVDMQETGDRHPLDKALRDAVLTRDNQECACCGFKMRGINSGSIAVHHIIPVHSGGKDMLENLITLCVRCHIALHICERSGGSFLMEKEDFEKLSADEQHAMKRALKYAKVAIDADKRSGLSKDDVKNGSKEALKHPKPKAQSVPTRAVDPDE